MYDLAKIERVKSYEFDHYTNTLKNKKLQGRTLQKSLVPEFTDLVGHMVQSNKGETHSDVLLLLPHQYNQKPTMKARAPVEPQEACEGAHRRYTLREPVGSRGGRGRPTRLK